MSAPTSASNDERWQWLPRRLRPLEAEQRGGGRRWLIESAILVAIGVFLAAATLHDVHRQVHINHRLIADLRTWRTYTGHHYHDISISQELLGPSEHDVACGNTTAGPPKTKMQICLAIWGPERGGVRAVHGGWYLSAHAEDDVRALRYGCFGAGSKGLCAR
jgi:hypothetical protein